MLRVLLCCMDGFSSGAMVQKVTKEIAESGYDLYLEFHNFSSCYKVMDQFHITCPAIMYGGSYQQYQRCLPL